MQQGEVKEAGDGGESSMLIHMTRNELQTGDVIAPGNWGSVSRQHRDAHGSWQRGVASPEAAARRYWSRGKPRFNTPDGVFIDELVTLSPLKVVGELGSPRAG